MIEATRDGAVDPVRQISDRPVPAHRERAHTREDLAVVTD